MAVKSMTEDMYILGDMLKRKPLWTYESDWKEQQPKNKFMNRAILLAEN